MSWEMIVLGLSVGFLVGLTGVGGAALLTPLLVLFGINPSMAVGTDLAYNSITKLFGSLQHYRQKTIDWLLVKYLSVGSIPGAIVAVLLLKIFDTFFENQEKIILNALGYVLIIVALLTLLRTIFKEKLFTTAIQNKPFQEKRGLTITIGVVLGFLVGLTSIGSGSLFAVALLLFYKLQPAALVGTDITHAFFLVTVAGILHASIGNIDYLLMFNLLIGSIPGVLLGSGLSIKVATTPLRAIIAVFIFFSGIQMI